MTKSDRAKDTAKRLAGPVFAAGSIILGVELDSVVAVGVGVVSGTLIIIDRWKKRKQAQSNVIDGNFSLVTV